MSALPLQGLHILVTRPSHQAQGFAESLAAYGASAHIVPVIAIQTVPEVPVTLLKLKDSASYDWLIFISANAVDYGLALLGKLPDLSATQIAAIGKKTAARLEHYGLKVAAVPQQGFTSENLLALTELQHLNQQQILIVRGIGGRELLAKTLQERGAAVSYADVYQRIIPTASAAALKQLHAESQLDIICLTSSESLRNLIYLAQSDTWIYHSPLVVGSRRIAVDAQQLGFTNTIIVATSPADTDMLAALLMWQQDNK